MRAKIAKVISTVLCLLMLINGIPMSVFAANSLTSGVPFNPSAGSNYYQLISKRDWTLAPGVQETEIVLNNDAGSRRQVVHSVTVDMNNPYTKVVPGYKAQADGTMIPQMGGFGTESTSVQAKNAEKLGYGNVVAATNAMLSWYDNATYKAHPEYVGEPLYYGILNGQYYESQYSKCVDGYAAMVINYDVNPTTGEPRPADIPKVQMREQKAALTGWEENVICVWAWLVKPDANGNPVSQYQSEQHTSGKASRTFVGVKADGTIVLAVSDGEQMPYSDGFSMNEMADYMIKMGCVYAANCDGGGSTTFCSQRPGEDFKVNCHLSDGGERPTTNTILVISDAPADGVFARADISCDFDYYTPGSTIEFSSLGTDASGMKVDVPTDVIWEIAEDNMGTIESGIFSSNGNVGAVTVQMKYQGNVVGEKTITIAIPDALSFSQPVITIPYGKTADIPVKATIDGGLHEIGLGSEDVSFATNNEALGYFSGLNFVAVSEENAPPNVTSTVTATLNMGANPTATVELHLGKASEILWDFEGGQSDIDEWNVVNNRNGKVWDYQLGLSLADKTNGQVHDGNYSMRLETNGISSKDSTSKQYAWIRLGVDGDVKVLENARSVGFWLYVPEDNIQCWVQCHYMTDSNGDGVFDTENVVSLMESENVYYNIDESGWHYLSMDISAFKEIALRAATKYEGTTGEMGEYFLALVFHKGTNNRLWQTNGSINGKYTYYLDNFTVDYSDAVDDREEPVFGKIYVDGAIPLEKREVKITTNNVLNLSATVADASTKMNANKQAVAIYNATGLNADSAKIYIDGVEVNSTLADGTLSANGIAVADGYHRVKFEICDNVGNKAVVIRVVKVESGVDASTVRFVPANENLNRIPFGSIYWMNLEANKIETIQKIETVIDLNNVNHWQLDNMELAYGFTSDYSINQETNTATITITRTGDNHQTGDAILAKIPVRILYYDTDINIPGYTAQTYWTTYPFWPQDMKMDVDKGVITYVDGYTSNVLNVFSNEEFHVDTEMYTISDQIDKTYWVEHGTTHVHTVEAIADKTPTCTENGYSGRTFCTGCNSIIDWGTTIPATGHTYHVVGNQLVCDCGEVLPGTGLKKIDNQYFYLVNGKLTGGWITVGDDWYYFDTTTYHSVDTYNNGYVTFKFDIDGKMISGEWYYGPDGVRYYSGPSYIRGGKNVMTWYEIDGKNYCFDKKGYAATGTRWVNDIEDTSETYTWYNFDEKGACQGKWIYTGLAEWNGNHYYVKNGISQTRMFYVDGDYYYFHWNDYRAAIKDQQFYCKYNNGLLPAGYYRFGSDGKMLNDAVYNVNGTLYYFVLGKEAQGSGSVEYRGQITSIDTTGKVLYSGSFMDDDGYVNTFVDGILTSRKKNGIFKEEGKLYYYENSVKVQKGLVKDDNGDYYYFGLKYYAVTEGTYDFPTEKLNGLLPKGGIFKVGADGKVIVPEPKNGIVAENGKLYYYENDVKVKKGLVKDSNGDYYYFGLGYSAVSNGTFYFPAEKMNGLFPNGGTFNVGADGKVIIPEPKNGIVAENGKLYYYENDVKVKKGLVKDSNGDYYYFGLGYSAVSNGTFYFPAEKMNGLFPNGGTFNVGADGKVIIPEPKNGIVAENGKLYYYENDVKVKKGLVKDSNGDYYYFGLGYNAVTNGTFYFPVEKMNGLFPNGGTFNVGADGKVIIPEPKNGIVAENGKLYYYENDVRVQKGLVKDYSGNYYYFGLKYYAVTNGTYYFPAEKMNGLYPVGGTFLVEAEGKVQLG